MMKVRTMLLTVALTVGSVTAATTLAWSPVSCQQTNTTKGKNGRTHNNIALQCTNPGGQQDVSKTPNIKNSTPKKIPAGKTLYWESSDGDSGTLVLTTALAPGDKVGVTGKPGQSYTCIAWTTK